MLGRPAFGGACTIAGLMWVVGILLGIARPADAARDISPQRECANCHVAWMVDFNRKDVTTLIPFDPKPTVATGRQDVVSTDRMCFTCHDGFVLDSRFVWQNRQNFHPIGIKPSSKIKIPTLEGKQIFPMNDDGNVYCGTCHSAHGIAWSEKESPIFLRMKNIGSSMCLACHLERSTGPEEGNHPVGKKLKDIPGSLVDAGALFSRDDKVICQSCHRVHGAPEKKLLVTRNHNSELCGTCHADRYARSRAEAGAKGTHPVNIVPDKVKIPEPLLAKGSRLGEGGTVICQTCHKPHFAEHDAKLLVEPNPQAQLCKACHADQRRVETTKHNIALLDREDKNIRGETVDKAGACSACHVPHGGQGPKMWARPITKVDDPLADACFSCHRDNGLAKDKLVGEHTHPVGRDMARLGEKVNLPGFTPEGVKSTGDAKGRVTCASCHDVHQWDPRDPEKTSEPGGPSDGSNRFLRVPYDREAGLCLTCHKGKGGVANTKHDLRVMAPEERNIIGKTPAEAGICASCHLPHKGNGPRMWARQPASGVDPVSSVCFSCHQPEGLAKDKTIRANSHPVAVPISNIGVRHQDGKWTAQASGAALGQSLPLYDNRGAGTSDGGNVVCGTCHDPHNWSAKVKGSPTGDPRQTKGDSTTTFLRLSNDEKGTLCATCHIDKGPIALSKHNLNISAPGERNVKGKTTGEGGVCSACHLPHNGNGAKMWARGTGPGQDGIEVLCRECHRDGAMAEKKQTGTNTHPLGVAPSGGAGDLPLYRTDGVKDNDGNVTCASCHNLHQWDPTDPKSRAGARADVEGDAANSFLRQPAWPAPQLCANCHSDKRSVKGTDHDLGVTAPEARNSRGQNVRESGVCGQCHTVHNAEQKERLWARDTGPGGDAMERYCRACHSAGKAASAKIPVKLNHPPHVTVASNPGRQRGEETFLPVFSPDGKRGTSGVITCPSCHNVHRWSPSIDEGPGTNVEGDARSSFLRGLSDSNVCSDCHGLDALFRYKYFHGETSRRKHRLYE